MTVMIAGAGIGGLSLGLSLHSQGIAFKIFEKAEAFLSQQDGITLAPYAVRELYEMGLEDALAEISYPLEETVYYNRQGQKIHGQECGMKAEYRWPELAVDYGKLHRLLHETLLKRAGQGALHMGAALHSYAHTKSGRVMIRLQDAQGGELGHEVGDLLVGADGAYSTLRAQLYPEEGRVLWRDAMTWRGVAAGPSLGEDAAHSMIVAGGRDETLWAYPIARREDGALYAWRAQCTMPPDYDWLDLDWARLGAQGDVLPEFEDWHIGDLDLGALIRTSDTVLAYALADRDPLMQWSFGPVTLLGDAAHLMPLGRGGAAQAILDARVMVAMICEYGLGAEALTAYDNERRPQMSATLTADRKGAEYRVLEVVERRAPDGFERIDDVIGPDEMGYLTAQSRALEPRALNARPSILGAF
jgi:2-polyprenyl-6-methoxyphenol hydroxylase-like FAD-dependent oxidoreductase